MNALLRSAILRIKGRRSPLAYNLNWGIRTSPFRDFLRNNPVSVIDVGARGGVTNELCGIENFLRYVGFDADREECHRLMMSSAGNYASYQVLPYFIGAGGNSSFHLYTDRGTSSSYLLNREFCDAFLDPAPRIEQTMMLQSSRLDDVIDQEHLDFPDFLKLDTQGSELDVLRGAGRTLTGTLLLETEVEFYPVYEGQPLFSDVDVLLRSFGFELLYLNRVFAQRKNLYKGLSRGQLLFGDALYGRNPLQLGSLSPERIAKYVILLCHYGHVDLGYQVFRENSQVQKMYPEISTCFSAPPSRVRKGVSLLLDRLILVLLHARRTNHMLQDSDRMWPVR